MQTNKEKKAGQCPRHDRGWDGVGPYYLCGCAMDKRMRRQPSSSRMTEDMPPYQVLGEDDGYHD
ncbi:hypothetical protein P9A57_gp65 [Pseudomonas phage phiH1]|uniref:Uncharacterized protein n=1 Tax=Pseudomonas phage phiH1 TaxID=2982871 RepID=A0AAX3D194_9CAUD|nr:hypothetical protein P9A57_gp65 [Pseudomonas phage phiH1]UYD21631.1 hypothetical protein [Pseudomonas phage phiH1]